MKCSIICASTLGATSVILGAMGAHALRNVLSEQQLESFNTGVRYQMWHVLAILLTVLLSKQFSLNLGLTLWLFLVGVLLFSGSIYLLSTIPVHGIEAVRKLGPITPLGGLLLIASWVSLAIQVARST